MMRLRDYVTAGLHGDFSEWPGAFVAVTDRAACLLRPHLLEHDNLPGGTYDYEPPEYEPYCPRCDYDYDPSRRRGPSYWPDFAKATILRYYDARFLIGCWLTERRWGLREFIARRVLRRPEPEA